MGLSACGWCLVTFVSMTIKKRLRPPQANRPSFPRVNAPQADRDRVRMETIRAAEEIISPAPSWLPDFLSELSFELVSAHGIEEIWPTREEMREELLEIHRLVDLLSDRLENFAVTGFMEADTADADAPRVLSDIARVHSELRALVRRALESPQLVGKNGKLLILLSHGFRRFALGRDLLFC